MKSIIKFLSYITLSRVLVNLSKSQTVHYSETLDQMNKTAAGIYQLSDQSERVINNLQKELAELQKEIGILNKEIISLEVAIIDKTAVLAQLVNDHIDKL